jgi:DNA polymerase elongation subunit (family B)
MNIPIYTENYGKGKVRHVFVNDSGDRCVEVVPFKATLFNACNENTGWKSTDGYNVEPFQVESVYDYVKEYENIRGAKYFGDVDSKYQFLAERYPDELIAKKGQIPRAFFDIEVGDFESGESNDFPYPESASQEVVSIAIYFEKKEMTYVLGLKDGYIAPSGVKFIKKNNEVELLNHFWSLINSEVCIIIGWHSSGFDIPYLINRSNNIGIDLKKMLPFGHYRKTFERVFNNQTYDIAGIIHFDYMPLLKKFMAYEPLESYSLDYAGKYFLGEGKVDYHTDHDSLGDLYRNDYQKFIEYNIKDVMLMVEIEKKKKLAELVTGIALKAKVNLGDAFSPVKIWDTMIYNKLIKNKIVVPRNQISSDDEGDSLEGAYVLEPIRGMHDWIASFDFGSLYPNIMISWNMSKQSLLKTPDITPELRKIKEQVSVEKLISGDIDLTELKKHNVSMSGAGHFFDTSKTDLICDIVNDIYFERKSIQKKMGAIKEKLGENEEYNQLENISWALKIMINSYYGICANKFFRFYSFEVAESVTLSGQVMIKSIREKLNNYYKEKFNHDNAIKQGDTDSLYITMLPFLESYEKKIGKTLDMKGKVDFIKSAIEKVIQPKVAEFVTEKLNYMNTLKQTLEMNYEKLSVAAIIIQKKKYVLSVIDDGKKQYIDNPKPFYKGVEIVRTSTPQSIRNELKNCVNHIFKYKDNNLLREYVMKFRDEVYMKLPCDQIARPMGVSEIKKFRDKQTMFRSGTPIHVRASILYNHLVTSKGLSKKYELIKDGNKIKFVYLKMPNPLKQDIIGFPNGINLPEEFNLNKYVDYKTQFEKTFLSPLSGIFESIGWELNYNLKESKKLF